MLMVVVAVIPMPIIGWLLYRRGGAKLDLRYRLPLELVTALHFFYQLLDGVFQPQMLQLFR